MPTLVGFGTFAALPEEQISEKISRRILSGDQGMIVWWSIGAGVHVESHSHTNEQIVWMLKGKMEFRLGSEQRVCGPGDVVVIPGGTEHEGWFPEDTEVIDFFATSARRLPRRRQTRLHERRLNRSLRLLTDRAHVQFAPRERRDPCRTKPRS
jgi:quercetin dioxygenase-like cupin family protein